MIKGILDTNIITALFKDNLKCVQKYEEYLNNYGTIHLSLIVYYELYRGLLYLSSKKKIERFKDFIQNCTI
jgi:predicted nucleic acid-binding protein